MSKTLTEFLAQATPYLVDSANLAANFIVANPSSFGFTAGTASAIGAATAALQTSYEDLLTAKSAYEQAVKNQASVREAYASTFTGYLGQAIAKPNVSDATLAAIGLQGRAPRVERPLRQPLNLVVTPNTNGYIVAKWKRNENTNVTSFVLEELQSDGSWEVVWIGTRIRCELQGYAPGVEATFRVYATKGGNSSQPSNSYTIYGAGNFSSLKMAA